MAPLQARSRLVASDVLDFVESTRLILRAEREKHRGNQGYRNTQKLLRVELTEVDFGCRRTHPQRQAIREEGVHTHKSTCFSPDSLEGMAILPICIWGEPVLHTRALPVTTFDEKLKTLVNDMYETMDAAPGVGLAAPQIGVNLRLFVWSYADQNEAPARGVAINPELWLEPISPGEPDEEEDVEGCLSFPGERFPVRRSERVILRAVDLDNKPFEFVATGWFARIMQHEYDHLDGLIYVDRLVAPHDRAAAKAERKNSWGKPGLTWLPGVDHLEG